MEAELLRHCAYNETSDRLLGVDVAAADFSDSTLHERIGVLRPRSGTGLWMVPFRGLPTEGLGMPLDLLYLDESCKVIDAVESYPRFRVSSSARPAASVLALPAESIATSHTQPGDQLLVCTADELKIHLRQRTQPAAQIKQNPASGSLFRGLPAKAPEPKRAVAGPMANGQPVKPKSWWKKLLEPEPADPRRATRERLPGLVAHYWTGGAPKPSLVRDISASGLYVVTDERWYPGTMVRLTLTCRDPQGFEQALTVESRAMRWGNDGVGLEFIMLDPESPERGEWLAPNGANREQFESFIKKIKGMA